MIPTFFLFSNAFCALDNVYNKGNIAVVDDLINRRIENGAKDFLSETISKLLKDHQPNVTEKNSIYFYYVALYIIQDSITIDQAIDKLEQNLKEGKLNSNWKEDWPKRIAVVKKYLELTDAYNKLLPKSSVPLADNLATPHDLNKNTEKLREVNRKTSKNTQDSLAISKTKQKLETTQDVPDYSKPQKPGEYGFVSTNKTYRSGSYINGKGEIFPIPMVEKAQTPWEFFNVPVENAEDLQNAVNKKLNSVEPKYETKVSDFEGDCLQALAQTLEERVALIYSEDKEKSLIDCIAGLRESSDGHPESYYKGCTQIKEIIDGKFAALDEPKEIDIAQFVGTNLVLLQAMFVMALVNGVKIFVIDGALKEQCQSLLGKFEGKIKEIVFCK